MQHRQPMSLSLSQLHSVHHIISDCQLARHCYWLQQCSALSTQQSISVLSTLFARSNSQPAMQYTVWHNMQVLQMYTQNYRSYLSLTHNIKISKKKYDDKIKLEQKVPMIRRNPAYDHKSAKWPAHLSSNSTGTSFPVTSP